MALLTSPVTGPNIIHCASGHFYVDLCIEHFKNFMCEMYIKLDSLRWRYSGPY